MLVLALHDVTTVVVCVKMGLGTVTRGGTTLKRWDGRDKLDMGMVGEDSMEIKITIWLQRVQWKRVLSCALIACSLLIVVGW